MRLFVGFLKEVKETVAPKSMLQQEREVLDGLLVPAVVIDEAGLINCFNKTAENFFGYKLVEVIGKNVSSLMPSPHREVRINYLANLKMNSSNTDRYLSLEPQQVPRVLLQDRWGQNHRYWS